MNREEDAPTAEVSADSLLNAVKSFLIEDAAPHLEGRDRFNARVAANVLGIIQRELAMRPALEALDQDAAAKWLTTVEVDIPVAQQLSRALARREIIDNAAFFDYLKTRQLLVTSINNPKYASRAIAEQRWQSD
ncbi:MAG: DUF6285 domain-containing protein [Halieaceae bacterium]|jgi:hypothetical protein